MDGLKKTAALLIALAILVGLGAAAWYGGDYVIQSWSRLDATASTVLLSAAVVILIAARIVGNGPVRAVRLESQLRGRVRRAEVYSEVLRVWTGEADERPAAGDSLLDAEVELALWGDFRVNERYFALRRAALDGAAPERLDVLSAELLRALRSDLGAKSDWDADMAAALLRHGLARPEGAAGESTSG